MRVIIAARKSKGKNQDGTTGITTQDKRSREWAEREGHEVIDTASDHAKGTVPPWERPELRKWMADDSERLADYDGIVAYKNDRLSRGAWDDEVYIRLWAKSHGKTLMIVDGPQWPPRHEGDKWSWEAMASEARKYWEAVREGSMRAQAELREIGALVGRPPFGYDVAGVKGGRYLVPNADGLRWVPYIFDRCIAGDSLATVCDALDAAGVKPPKAGGSGRWSEKSVSQIIRCKTYIGRRKQGNTVLANMGHDYQIIDADIQRQAVAKLESRPKRGPAAGDSLMSAILRCGVPECDATGPKPSPMYRKQARDGEFYYCSGRGTRRHGCGNMVPCSDVDRAVEEVVSHLDRKRQIAVMVPGTNWQTEIAEVAADIQSLDPIKDRDRYAALFETLTDLEGRPATEDTVSYQDTAETYSELWNAGDIDARRQMLKAWRLTWSARKEGAQTVVIMGLK